MVWNILTFATTNCDAYTYGSIHVPRIQNIISTAKFKPILIQWQTIVSKQRQTTSYVNAGRLWRLRRSNKWTVNPNYISVVPFARSICYVYLYVNEKRRELYRTVQFENSSDEEMSPMFLKIVCKVGELYNECGVVLTRITHALCMHLIQS